jgi:hypothetical protein
MEPCNKSKIIHRRKCIRKEPSVIMNLAINSFKKINDLAIHNSINFTASLAQFIALYDYYSMDKLESDDTKRILQAVDNDVMYFKDQFNSIYSIRNYKYEILKTHINDFEKYIKSNFNLKYDIMSKETINDIKYKINSINNEIAIFNSTQDSMSLNMNTIKLYNQSRNYINLNL